MEKEDNPSTYKAFQAVIFSQATNTSLFALSRLADVIFLSHIIKFSVQSIFVFSSSQSILRFSINSFL
jgi:hypothetical protein